MFKHVEFSGDDSDGVEDVTDDEHMEDDDDDWQISHMIGSIVMHVGCCFLGWSDWIHRQIMEGYVSWGEGALTNSFSRKTSILWALIQSLNYFYWFTREYQ